MARVKMGLGGGGCPTKGGDIGDYPWGDPGSAWPTNYEEIVPLCDGYLIDIKTWANLDKPWDEDHLFLGNAGHTYGGQTQVKFQAQANHYGVFKDPYNEGKTNPYELDFTEDHEIQEIPEDSADVPVVDFIIDFGKEGTVNEYQNVTIDYTPRTCLADEANAEAATGAVMRTTGISLAFLGLFLLAMF